jgi:mRNA-degrading endonuclease RelE of RelBE toxin-antitoxin system
MECRVTIRWTQTAKDSLGKLPKKVRKGLLKKADELQQGGDPRTTCKPLTGPLQGYYRIVYSRYRAIFSAEEEVVHSGNVLIHVKVIFIAAGIRKELDKNDIYRVAQKLVETVLDEGDEGDAEPDANS